MTAVTGNEPRSERPPAALSPGDWAQDLAAARRSIVARKARAAAVQDLFRAAKAQLQLGDPVDVLTVRCDQDRRGSRSTLAKVYVTKEGLLFSSRIRWLPSDQLTLRPWEHDGMLAVLDPAIVEDDERLAGALQMFSSWRQGHPATGKRWLKDRPPLWVQDVLDLPADPHTGWLPDLWVRCGDHPDRAEALDRQELMSEEAWGRLTS